MATVREAFRETGATWETRKRAEITTFMIFAFHNMGVLTTRKCPILEYDKNSFSWSKDLQEKPGVGAAKDRKGGAGGGGM